MNTTAKSLIKAILEDDYSLISIPIIHDYFGLHNGKNINMLFGLYGELIQAKGVSLDLLHNCFITNRLDILINSKFKYNSCGYYEYYSNNHIVIGKTFVLSKNTNYIEHMIIYDDNYCPNCNCNNYITDKLYISPPDCFKCFKVICKKCSIYNKTNNSYKCKTTCIGKGIFDDIK